ncbi:MAG: hypothetical protein ABIJ53_09220, partial [Verrucomicrobiota bacterium]
LAYLDAEKNKQKPPKADPDDERFDALAGADDDMDDEEDNSPDIEFSSPATKKDDPVRKHLEGLSKNELVNFLLEGRNTPELRKQLSDRAELKEGNVAKMIATTRRDIDKASREPGWTNHWRDESNIPDYSRVKQRLENMLAAGQADAVVELGAYLMKRGIQQVEQSNDEGETGTEIAECMEVVFKAVMQSNLSVPQRLLWEINMCLQDDYCILDGLKGPLEKGAQCAKEDWGQVADVMAARLAKMPECPAGARNDFSSKYDRERIMRWLLHALEYAGRDDEMIPILERETARTQCYVELMKKLVESGQTEKAREWARKGFVETLEHAPGIAWQLEEKLRELAVRAKNYPLAAAYRTMEFFNKTDLQSYSKLQEVAIKADVWDKIRGPILNYLETGRRPDTAAGALEHSVQRKRKQSAEAFPDGSAQNIWPLPLPELPPVKKDTRWTRFPDISTLIDIAIKESRHDDALRWYRKNQQLDAYGGDQKGMEVAHAVSKTHPADAIDIWKKLVSRATTHANISSYQTAGGYLKQMRGIYEQTNRTAEWNAYLADLRQQNGRRPRMLDVLNSLEGRRTPIVRR